MFGKPSSQSRTPLIAGVADFSFATLAGRYRERLIESPQLTGRHDDDRIAATELINGWLAADGVSAPERQRLLDPLVDDLVGFGPLELLFADADVTEVMVNGTDNIWVEVDGIMTRTETHFRDSQHLRTVVDRLLLGSGRRLDEGSPRVDARLADGGRLNAVLPPVAVGDPLITIRRPPRTRLDLGELLQRGAMSQQMAAFLHAAVLGRANMLICGGAGTGKTTVLAALAGLAPEGERLVVIEDVSELVISHPHVVSQECRPGGVEGVTPIGVRELVRNSLRMRPDRLVVGEVRGAEAGEMVQAMNTGHAGSMASIHANSAADALDRLEAMLALAWPAIAAPVLRRWIVGAVDVVVHCERDGAGRRRIGSIAAVDSEHGVDDLMALFVGRGDRFSASGEVPRRCLERMAYHGTVFPPRLFADAA